MQLLIHYQIPAVHTAINLEECDVTLIEIDKKIQKLTSL